MQHLTLSLSPLSLSQVISPAKSVSLIRCPLGPLLFISQSTANEQCVDAKFTWVRANRKNTSYCKVKRKVPVSEERRERGRGRGRKGDWFRSYRFQSEKRGRKKSEAINQNEMAFCTKHFLPSSLPTASPSLSPSSQSIPHACLYVPLLLLPPLAPSKFFNFTHSVCVRERERAEYCKTRYSDE